jgi:SAM-dependent methyltransferase
LSADPATLAFYEARAAQYVTRFGQKPSRHLDDFLDSLEPGARILELGCGSGRDAARMIERGFAVDATDGTAAMVREANRRTGLAAREMRFDELDACNEYDAVWGHACLIHVARADLPATLSVIVTALKPAGLHYGSFKLGTGEARDPLGRLHNFPDREWIEAAYRAAGFTMLDLEIFRGGGADGVVRDWIALTARKG